MLDSFRRQLMLRANQMRIRLWATMITMAMSTLLSCGQGATIPPLKIDGGWLYLGPSDGPHELTIGHGSMVYTDIAGTWSSKWIIQAYNNELRHFQVTFDSGSGTYVPFGQSMSGTYDLSATLLTVQLANGLAAYPTLQSPGTCTDATTGTPIPECRLYVTQQN